MYIMPSTPPPPVKGEKRVTITNGQVFPSTLIAGVDENLTIRFINNDSRAYLVRIEHLAEEFLVEAFTTETISMAIGSQGVYNILINGRAVGKVVVLEG